ncbi:hypothetical protein TNCV_1591541 [Trichonephila clavipes]|nr:hypothetical protein TNCV_1591541 [Trichonephila clavipes]
MFKHYKTKLPKRRKKIKYLGSALTFLVKSERVLIITGAQAVQKLLVTDFEILSQGQHARATHLTCISPSTGRVFSGTRDRTRETSIMTMTSRLPHSPLFEIDKLLSQIILGYL